MNEHKMTSIIMNTYIQSPMVAQMTMASLAAIRKFTDQPYEIIVIDNEPKFPIRDEYEVLKLDQYIRNDTDIGCYASYNLGASKATGDYLVFIQNDVFVPEGWLRHMRFYLENEFIMKDGSSQSFHVVYPDQVPRSRIDVIYAQNAAYGDEVVMKGSRDAGLMMITKEGFNKVGGWPEGSKTAILAEKFMYQKIARANLYWTDTRKVQISHIMAATNLIKLHEDPDGYNAATTEEEKLTI